jgi:RND family efflux transporter MFP subunit
VKVEIETPDSRRVEGELSFINNTVSTGTGTINLKASLPNAKQALWPGAYVKTTVYAGLDHNAMVLPPAAMLEGPTGRFVYVIDGAGKVAAKPVTLVRVQDQRAIVEGLQTGDRIVLDGNQNVAPGVTVQVAKQANVAGTP